MARSRDTIFIPIPIDRDYLRWKVEVTTAGGVITDVTNYCLNGGSIVRMATEGLSNFSIMIDNNDGRFGRYTPIFAAGDTIDVYYDHALTATTHRFRGYADGVYFGFNGQSGVTLTLDGRDAPPSDANVHFADTKITLQFTARNNLDCWIGGSGSQDAEGNYEDGVLYNTGLVMRVYDTSSSSWKDYKDLNESERITLQAVDGYGQNNTAVYVDSSPLSDSKTLAEEGDYEFRIWHDYASGINYFMVHPEGAVDNDDEGIVAGQNLLSIDRLGADTTNERNRVKVRGFSDGNIITARTKSDTGRQSALWIKDFSEASNSIKTDAELDDKAEAVLARDKEATTSGAIACLGIPSLQPAERAYVSIPNVYEGRLLVKSFTITFGGSVGLEFSVDIKDRETRFEELFKDRIDENTRISVSDNPNGMRNAIVLDFTEGGYELVDCQIVSGVLSLESGESEGICTTPAHEADADIVQCELRVLADQFWNCTYRLSNNNGSDWVESVLPGTVVNFVTTGKRLVLEVTLLDSTTGVSPGFNKVNLLYK